MRLGRHWDKILFKKKSRLFVVTCDKGRLSPWQYRTVRHDLFTGAVCFPHVVSMEGRLHTLAGPGELVAEHVLRGDMF